MIKETVDAVRLAELEGDKVISTAKVNGQDMKNQIKIQGAEYRTERLKEAKEKAEDSCKMRKVQWGATERDWLKGYAIEEQVIWENGWHGESHSRVFILGLQSRSQSV